MDEIYKYQEKWKQDPLLCTYSLFIPSKQKLYKEQEEIIQSAILESETYVKSYHGAGKTYTAALAALTFLFIYMPSKVVTTAPGWTQVKFLLWAEIRNIWKRSPIINVCEKTGLKMYKELGETRLALDEDWFAIGLSPKIDKGEDASKRMTGFHAENFLAVLDEGPAVSPVVWEAISTLLTSSNSHLLAIGNPVDSSGDFYRGFQDTNNKKISLDIFQNPNFVANDIKSLADLEKLNKLSKDKLINKYKKMKYPFPAVTNPKWAIGRLRKWGKDSPLFRARVLSQFPKQSSNSLISLSDLEYCRNESIEPRPGRNVLGCDPARFGEDNTVIYGVKHWKEHFKEVYNGKDTMKTANRLIYLWRESLSNINEKYNIIVIDPIGIGAGVLDRLREYFKDVTGAPKVLGIGSNNKPSNAYEDTCADMVTELFKRLDELLKKREIGINDDGEMFAQLTNRRYKYTSKGLMQMESKDDYKARTGSGSPDEGDAILLTVYGLTLGSVSMLSKSIGEDRTTSKPGWE